MADRYFLQAKIMEATQGQSIQPLKIHGQDRKMGDIPCNFPYLCNRVAVCPVTVGDVTPLSESPKTLVYRIENRIEQKTFLPVQQVSSLARAILWVAGSEAGKLLKIWGKSLRKEGFEEGRYFSTV